MKPLKMTVRKLTVTIIAFLSVGLPYILNQKLIMLLIIVLSVAAVVEGIYPSVLPNISRRFEKNNGIVH